MPNVVLFLNFCITTYSASSSSSSKACLTLQQLTPLQFLHDVVHTIPFFRQVHLLLSHEPLHPHLIIFNISFGAGGRSVVLGKNNLSFINQPQSVSFKVVTPNHIWIYVWTQQYITTHICVKLTNLKYL
jgi:hypothetical protein